MNSILENMWWKAQVVIFNSFSMLLALIWTIQLVRTRVMLANVATGCLMSCYHVFSCMLQVRTIHAEAESVNLAAAEDTGYLATINPFQVSRVCLVNHLVKTG